jgi:hypothetical protein
MTLDLATVLQIGTTAFVGVILYILQDLRTQFKDMRILVDEKLDRNEHEKDQSRCVDSIRTSMGETFRRLAEKQDASEIKFCGHSHEGLPDHSRMIPGRKI